MKILPLFRYKGLDGIDPLGVTGEIDVIIPKPEEVKYYTRRAALRSCIKGVLAASLAPWVLVNEVYGLPKSALMGGPPPAAGGSCPADGSPSVSTTGTVVNAYVAFNTGSILAGHTSWNDAGTSRTICKLGFKLTANGTISGKTYNAYIYSCDSGNTIVIASPLATSSGVTGSNSWSNTMVRFAFPTPYSTAGNAGTLYALAIGVSGGVDASNFVTTFNSAVDSIPGGGAQWDNLGNATYEPTKDGVIEIYWQ